MSQNTHTVIDSIANAMKYPAIVYMEGLAVTHVFTRRLTSSGGSLALPTDHALTTAILKLNDKMTRLRSLILDLVKKHGRE